MAFDEFWLLLRRVRPVVASVLGEDHLMMSEVFMFHLHSLGNRRGWGPHRDRSWTKGYRPLDLDGWPSSVNVWISLTAAHSSNGCIYALPKNRDPSYKASEREHLENPMEEQAFGKSLDASGLALQDIRALPATPGDM